MSLPVLDRDETIAALRDVTDRWTRLVRSLDDPSRPAIGHWDAGTVAAHVGHVFEAMAKCAAGTPSPITDHRAIPDGWERVLEADPERDLDTVARRAEEGLERFIEITSPANWTETRPWHGSLQVPMYSLAAILLNETQLHGRDVAAGSERDWVIPARHAALAIDGHLPFLPAFANEETLRSLDATYELNVRSGSKIYVTVGDGALSIDTEPPAKVDCRINADPVAYLLIGFGRISQWRPIATGKVIAWGRKPWLGLAFGKLFVSV